MAASRDEARAGQNAAERALVAARAELNVERRSFDSKLEGAVKNASVEAMKENNQLFLELADSRLKGAVGPLKDSLEKVDVHVRALEQARAQTFGALRQELKSVRDGQERLRATAGNLVTALRAPHVRGRWGEVQLRRVVEAAGMIEHCDFVAQASVRDGEGSLLRPDVVIRLPGGKNVVVDAKVPLAAYLDACECDDEDLRERHLHDHARQLRDHVGKLAAKAYWRQFAPAPDFVIMFLPDESFLRAAHEHDREIVEYSWQAQVVPASPTNLFALLRTIAATWQQETVAESAREVHGLGQELFDRLCTLAKHFTQVGRALEGAVGHYNRTVGTLETRVLVTGRKLEQHGIGGELPHVAPVEGHVRPLTAPELASGDEAHELPGARDAA
jgi:DNA recombination protein RmuC